jgi:hypothetical protein
MRKRALSLLRNSEHYRAAAFRAGLFAVGFEVVDELADPTPVDVVLSWNRSGGHDETCRRFERAGARVIIAENGYLGKSWRGEKWFALALGHHVGAGEWLAGGPERWDALQVPLAPWREDGAEVLVLEQRGIGEPGIASPPGWAERAARATGGRIRRHPGASVPDVSLEDDLIGVREVITWHSAGALAALMAGVPVFYDFPEWIGGAAARPLHQRGRLPPLRDDAARLTMFRNLAWAQWKLEEIERGEAFAHLLEPVHA